MPEHHSGDFTQDLGQTDPAPAVALRGELIAWETLVSRAARLAHVHAIAEALPDDQATEASAHGPKISGGKKQRVAIARTLLKQPTIFLFDEATSSLDSKTERQIQESLKEVSRNRTTLVIAHRLSTVVEADEILVLEAGQIVERGRHATLLAKGGRYAEMWQRQQAAQEEKEIAPAAE